MSPNHPEVSIQAPCTDKDSSGLPGVCGGVRDIRLSLANRNEMNPRKPKLEEPILVENAGYDDAHHMGGQSLCVAGSVKICRTMSWLRWTGGATS